MCDTKTLSGFGGGVGILEVTGDFRGDTFRVVYTVQFAGAVHVSPRLPEKSKTGRQTPRRDIELIRRWLREAEQIAKKGGR